METINITYPRMLMMYGMLAVPILLILILKIGIIRSTLISVLRMTLQLSLVGLYLDLIFRLNNVWLNLAWLLVMIVVANINVIRSSGLKLQKFFFIVLTGIIIGTFFVVSIFLFLTVRPSPIYDARYLIPITGMVLGNCLRANVISLERFFSSIRKNEKEFLTFLLMGATLYEAVLPFLREAIKSALAPTVSTMATIGLVSLPGMMTGQILGGSFPEVAIKYQLAIMIAIFSATTITTVINLLLSIRVSFNEYHILRQEVFAR
jgi:UDP-glucose/iron transport system permease protein